MYITMILINTLCKEIVNIALLCTENNIVLMNITKFSVNTLFEEYYYVTLS